MITMLGEDYRQVNNQMKRERLSLADVIAHPEKYENERTEALKEWDAGVNQSEPNIMQCSDLRTNVEYIQKAFETIDLEKEALRYLGLQENREKISELLQNPDNQDKLKPFYDAVDDMVEIYDSDTFKAIRYDMEQDADLNRPADPDAGYKKFKDSLQALRNPSEKQRITLPKENTRRNTISIGRENAPKKSGLTRSNTQISNKK